jgi:hypothetical protein
MKLGMVAGNSISNHFSLGSIFQKSKMAAKIQDGRQHV